MPWGRLDDSLYDHPKLDDLPGTEEALEGIPGDGMVRLAAVGLWARSISWCNRFLTDGKVPRDRIVKLDGSRELADLLVRVGLFERCSGGYQVHDFLQFNDSRDVVLERRAKEAARKALWRKNRGNKDQPGDGPADGPGGTPNGDGPNVPGVVPPSVPASVPAGQDDVSRAESRRPSRRLSQGESRPESRDSTRTRDRANPDPSRPDLLKRDTPPNPPRRRGGRGDGIATTRDGRILPPGGYSFPVETDDDAPWAEPAEAVR